MKNTNMKLVSNIFILCSPSSDGRDRLADVDGNIIQVSGAGENVHHVSALGLGNNLLQLVQLVFRRKRGEIESAALDAVVGGTSAY